MNRYRSRRSITFLLGLVLLAFGYGAIEYYQHTLTGIRWLDGMIGVMLGLFISSRPAANFLDLLFPSAGDRRQSSAAVDRWIWLLLNALTLCAGVFVVIMGAIQLTRATPIPLTRSILVSWLTGTPFRVRQH